MLGLTFRPGATVGPPVLAVCDTVPGRITQLKGQTHTNVNRVEGWDQYLMLAYCCEQSGVDSRWNWIWWIVYTSAEIKTIQNSRALGYGQLDGHVASIVSYLFQKEFWKGIVPARYGMSNFGPERLKLTNQGLFYKKFCKEKFFFK